MLKVIEKEDEVQIMEKYIMDERTGINYIRRGDYYLPDLALPAEEEKPIGIWGRNHLQYIKKHRRIFYLNLLTSGKLNSYLFDVDRRAEDMFFRLVKEYADRQDVTEQLKAENQLEWVEKMNNIRACVREVVMSEVIYV